MASRSAVARAIASSEREFIRIPPPSFRLLQETLARISKGVAVGVLAPATDQPCLVAVDQVVVLQIMTQQAAD
jgi:hypothetical protein